MSAVHDIGVTAIDGQGRKLADYAGKVLLIVNVASKCGLTPQYEGMEQAWEKYRDQGLVVLGFPCNQFGGQEPGSEAEIQDFCQTNYSVSFPMFSKVEVNGEQRHPLYQTLISARPQATTAPDSNFKEKLAGYGIKPANDTDVLWNFEKFLVNRRGEVVGRFAPDMAPDHPLLVAAIEAELARS
jgi:glutathione peroxidase